jgi:D-cysteine desulfhydrase
MSLSEFPRIPLGNLPTPFVELKRLTKWLGGPKIFIKRDDLTGLGLGGNKIRKLEFLFGEAIKQNCDTVITGGAIQSNHCRQTAAAAASVGLQCHLALGGTKPETPNGNLLLDYLFGANIHYCGEKRKGEALPEIENQLKSEGRKPFVIPYGGSNSIGALGFVAAIGEMKEQMLAKGIPIDYIVFPSSSGGTHAGITTGVDLYGLKTNVIGIGIDQKDSGETPYESELACLGNELASKLNLPVHYNYSNFVVRKEYYGKGYGIMGDLEREAISSMARYEGILLDPVYSGRAMGGLIDMIKRKEFSSVDNVLFWHTGGTPALFDYARELL